jgi:zinc protease
MLLALLCPVLAQDADPDLLATSAEPEALSEDAPLRAPPPQLEDLVPGLQERVFDNGLRVTVFTDPDLPVVATQHWVHIGSSHESDAERGLAHFFEHLMFGDTSETAEGDYFDWHLQHGGYNNAYTSADETVYLSEIVPAAHDRVLELEALRFQQLVLDELALERERLVVQEELRQRTQNDPITRLALRLQTDLLGTHPYAITPAGTLEDLDVMTVESLRAFYDAWYRPNNVHIVVVGPISAERTFSVVDELYGDWTAGTAVRPEVPSLETWAFPESVEVTEDIPPVKVGALSYPLPAVGGADTWAVDLMLGLINGQSVNPFRELHVDQERRALEGMGGGGRQKAGGQLIFLSLSLPLRSELKLFTLLERSLTQFNELDWLTQERLDQERKRMQRSTLSDTYYADDRASSLGRAHWHMGDTELGFRPHLAYDQVTLEQVRDAYARYVIDATPVRIYAHKGDGQ